jgi:predicted nuclease of predicted toxin-antitoxin system
VKLLLDEQISGKVAVRLVDLGHDVIAATAERSLRGTGDPDLFELAQRESRAVVTYDRADFEEIVRQYAAAKRPHHGVVIVHPIRFPSWEFRRLAEALSALLDGPQPGHGFLIWLQPPER